MRIVITNKGTKIIEDLSPDNSLDYNSDTNKFNSSIIQKTRNKNLKRNKSLNIESFQKSKRFNSQKSFNIYSKEKNVDINDILNNLVNKQNLKNINRNTIDNIKIIDIKNNRKVKLPKLLESKYIVYDFLQNEKQKKILPNILLSINDNIDNDLLNKKKVKNMKSFSEPTINDFENNNDEMIFPTIRRAFPLKYIIGKDSFKRLNKEMSSLGKSCDLEKKLFPQNY